MKIQRALLWGWCQRGPNNAQARFYKDLWVKNIIARFPMPFFYILSKGLPCQIGCKWESQTWVWDLE